MLHTALLLILIPKLSVVTVKAPTIITSRIDDHSQNNPSHKNGNGNNNPHDTMTHTKLYDT